MSRHGDESLIAWRSERRLWTPLAWLAAVAWPGIAPFLIVFPPLSWRLGVQEDWRLTALFGAGLGVALCLVLLNRERTHGGRPATRVGVIGCFLLFGFFFTLLGQVVIAALTAVRALAQGDGLAHGLQEAALALFVYGIASLPVALAIGVSYALWAGLMVALIAFTPRQATRARPGAFEAYDARPAFARERDPAA